MTRVLRALGRRSAIEISCQPTAGGQHGYLAIATMAKNEAPYLAEWLTFHRIQGVEHVYIYDNGCDDATAEILAPYKSSGFVSIIDWPVTRKDKSQRRAFAHALTAHGGRWRWMAFIDVDEFLFSISSKISETLRVYEDLPALLVPWTMFGTSGHRFKPESMVIEAYTKKSATLGAPKSIVQPQQVRGISNVHAFDYEEGWKTGYNERGELVTCDGPFYSEVLRLNHYYTRSQEELERKLAIRGAYGENLKKKVSDTAARIELHSVYDDAILRFVPEIRDALAQERVNC